MSSAPRDYSPGASGRSHCLTILVPSVVIGIGGGLMNTPLATLVTTGIRPEHAGAASGLMNTSKQFGGAIGLAAASSAAAIADTDHAGFALMAVALVTASAVAAGIPQRHDPANTATTPARNS